ncbi:MAG TPA: BatD family protein [Longimicrobiales bacterium]|nr:BatD family protein [Longimicrobiales bacterium]
MFAAALLVLGVLVPQDQVRVHATLSDERIAVGASTMLQVSVEMSGGQPESIELPAFPPSLDVLSSREYHQTQLSLPGGRTTIVRRDIVLRARAEGLFTIDPITIHLPGGDVRRTRPLTLRVVAATPGAPLPPGVRRPVGGTPADAGTLAVTVTPDTAWLGEPVLLRMTARIPEEQRTRRGRSPVFEPPTAVGFWVQELEDRGAVGVRAIDGRYYDVHEYRRFYVPLTPGVRVLPPARAVYEVDRGWMFAPQSYELASDSVHVYVRALPEQGKPASFTGAVGRFEVSAQVDRTRLAEGDAATLTVVVEGTGNIKALPAPHLPQIPGVEVFEPSEDAEFVARTSGIRGSKTFRWILAPEAPGAHALPDIAYAWFDPATEQYDSARIPLPALEVGGVIAQGSAVEGDTSIAPIRPFPSGTPAFAWARSTGFAALQALPLLLLAATTLWRREAPRIQARRRRRQRLHADFSTVRTRASTDPRGALSELQRMLDQAIAALLSDEDAVSEEAALRARGAGENVLASLRSLRAAIHTMRFRREPVGAADVDALVRRAEALLGRLARATRARSHAAVLVLLPLLVFGGGSAHAAQESRFADGVAAFERGEYDAARAAFVEHLALYPQDASAWYDLGNTDYQRGARGAAVHAWGRALRLEPRADDTRRNLRVAGATDVLDAAVRPLPFTASELIGWAGMLWLIGGSLLALRMFTSGRAARVSGVAAISAVGLSACALLALAGRRQAPEQGVVVRATALRAAPGLHAEARAELEESALVRIVDSRDAWLHVRIDRDEGWIELRDVGLLD